MSGDSDRPRFPRLDNNDSPSRKQAGAMCAVPSEGLGGLICGNFHDQVLELSLPRPSARSATMSTILAVIQVREQRQNWTPNTSR